MLKGKCVKYKVEVSGIVEVHEDSYEDGYLNSCSSWELDGIDLSFETLEKENLLEIKKAVLNVLNNQLFSGTLECDNVSIDCDSVWTGQLANADNEEPSIKEIEAWENDEINLYSQDIYVFVHINGKRAETEDLEIIMNL